jgi:transketolase
MRNAFVKELMELAIDPALMVLLADNGIIMFDEFTEKYPDQILNVGIAEANMIGVAAGLAETGFRPIVYSIAPFVTMRVFEQIRNDICYQNTNVLIIGVGAGFAYSTSGPTHHAIEDIAIMRSLPNMKVLSPCDPNETRAVAKAAYSTDGPVYVRIGSGRNPIVYNDIRSFKIGKADELRNGSDASIIATGTIVFDALEAAAQLQNEGISVKVINMSSIKPLDTEIIKRALAETGAILTVEEHSIIGGLGAAVAEWLAEKGSYPFRFKRLGLNDTFCKGYGSVGEIRNLNGLSKEHIVEGIKTLIS